MSLAVTAVISSTVAVAGLAYQIDSSNQAKRIASQKENAANQIANTSILDQKAQQKTLAETQQRNLDISNERRRLSAPLAAVTTGSPTASSAIQPTPSLSASTPSPATVTRGQGTLLGS